MPVTPVGRSTNLPASSSSSPAARGKLSLLAARALRSNAIVLSFCPDGPLRIASTYIDSPRFYVCALALFLRLPLSHCLPVAVYVASGVGVMRGRGALEYEQRGRGAEMELRVTLARALKTERRDRDCL